MDKDRSVIVQGKLLEIHLAWNLLLLIRQFELWIQVAKQKNQKCFFRLKNLVSIFLLIILLFLLQYLLL